jgi:PAS domain-containing serine/threonine kinase
LSRPPVAVPNLRKDSSASKVKQDLDFTSSTQELFSKYDLHSEFCKKYGIDYELGRGGFGFVLAGHRLKDNHKVAIKFIFKNKVNEDSWVNDQIYGVIPLEVYILSQCSHPNIIQFQDYYDHDPFCYLVMDLHGSHWQKSRSSSSQSRTIKSTKPTQRTRTISTMTLHLSDLSLLSSLSNEGSLPKSPEKPALLARGITSPFPAQLQRRPSMDLFEYLPFFKL